MFPLLSEMVLLPLLLPLMVDGVLLPELDLKLEVLEVVDSVADLLLLDMVLGRMVMSLVRGTQGWNSNCLVPKVMVFTR
jgi:hypothetical protein